MSRLDDALEPLAAELVAWWEWLDTLSPEEREIENQIALAKASSIFDGGPCVQAPATYRKGE